MNIRIIILFATLELFIPKFSIKKKIKRVRGGYIVKTDGLIEFLGFSGLALLRTLSSKPSSKLLKYPYLTNKRTHFSHPPLDVTIDFFFFNFYDKNSCLNLFLGGKEKPWQLKSFLLYKEVWCGWFTHTHNQSVWMEGRWFSTLLSKSTFYLFMFQEEKVYLGKPPVSIETGGEILYGIVVKFIGNVWVEKEERKWSITIWTRILRYL